MNREERQRIREAINQAKRRELDTSNKHPALKTPSPNAPRHTKYYWRNRDKILARRAAKRNQS